MTGLRTKQIVSINKEKQMVELLIFIVGITALITFWSVFKKAGSAIEGTIDVALNTVQVINKTTDDSLATYAQKVTVANYRTREHTSGEIDDLTDVHTVASLEAKLAGLVSSNDRPNPQS